MTNPATDPQNERALKESIGTDDIGDAGGLMPREVYDQFYREAIAGTPLLDAIRTEDVSSRKTRIPRFGVGERQRRGRDEGSANARADVDAGFIDIDCKEGSVSWAMNQEVVDDYDQGEDIAEFILSQLADQFSVDTQEIAVRGDEEAATGDPGLNDFLRQNDGFLKIANERGMRTHVHENSSGEAGAISNAAFGAGVRQMPEKYQSRTDPVFIMSTSQLQAYQMVLSGEFDAAGYQVIMGDSDLTPFNYPIMGIPSWPDDQIMFTDPENLIYALYKGVEVEVLTESDEIAEKNLYAKYFLRTQDDFQIENVDAAVLVNGLQDPQQTMLDVESGSLG